eukprot:scaffold48651_cov57-Phaeocystis_antarctica.AAC.4
MAATTSVQVPGTPHSGHSRIPARWTGEQLVAWPVGGCAISATLHPYSSDRLGRPAGARVRGALRLLATVKERRERRNRTLRPEEQALGVLFGRPPRHPIADEGTPDRQLEVDDIECSVDVVTRPKDGPPVLGANLVFAHAVSDCSASTPRADKQEVVRVVAALVAAKHLSSVDPPETFDHLDEASTP